MSDYVGNTEAARSEIPLGRRAFGHVSVAVRRPWTRVIVRRLLLSVPVLVLVSASSFVLVALRPGDAARQLLGIDVSDESYRALRHELGLDQPVYIQYWHWLSRAIHGDLGNSLITQEHVATAIGARLPVTASLVGGAIVLTLAAGVGVGLLSAVRGGIASRVVDALTLVGFALPPFWVGAALIIIFAVDAGWFPVAGYVPLSDSPTSWLTSLVLPSVALSLHGIAAVAKQTREAVLDALASEYIRSAWASGIAPASIVFRHALKNAGIRVLTIVGLQVVGLLGGTVFVESVFALPGLGGLGVKAATQHDLPMVQGVVVCFTAIVIVVNLIVDLAYTSLDPRVRTE